MFDSELCYLIDYELFKFIVCKVQYCIVLKMVKIGEMGKSRAIRAAGTKWGAPHTKPMSREYTTFGIFMGRLKPKLIHLVFKIGRPISDARKSKPAALIMATPSI
jgi:hypothetical protein